MLRLFQENLLTPYKIAQIKKARELDGLKEQLESTYADGKRSKQREHKAALKALQERHKAELSKIKSGYKLPKRVLVLRETALDLRRQQALKPAADLEAQAKKLEEKFWHVTIGGTGGPIWRMKREERLLLEKQALESSALAVDLVKRRKECEATRLMTMQKSKNKATRRAAAPFSIWYHAAKGEYGPLSRYIKKHPDQIDSQDLDTGLTALHYASKYGKLECVKLLIESGANVDIRDGRENTALHYAVGSGSVQIAAVLIENGGDLRSFNGDEKTPKDVAKDMGRFEILAYLNRLTPVGISLKERKVTATPETDPFDDERDEAIRRQLRVLEMRQIQFGPKHPSAMITLKKLAKLYREDGRHQLAIEYLRRLLDIARESDQLKGTEVAWAANELGELLHNSHGDVYEAEGCFLQAIELLEQEGNVSPLDLEVPVSNLAFHYLGNNLAWEAEPMLKKLLTLQEDMGTTEMNSVSETVIPTLDLLGYTRTLMKEFDGAREAYEKARTIARQFYDDSDPQMAQRLENLGMVSFCEGDNVAAERYFQQAHDLIVKGHCSMNNNTLDAIMHHPDLQRIVGNIATSVVRRSGKKKF